MTAEDRVLLIEDDEDIALGIRIVLGRSGFEVAGAADGGQGLRAFYRLRPDLVILDIGLPALDGWAVLERIRDLSDVPVLILTAHGQESEKVRGLHGGADDYLTKPFGNEFRLLAALVRNKGQTLTPGKLLELVWNDPFGAGPGRVKYAVMRLRRKLAGADWRIEAVRGSGYRYRNRPAPGTS